MDGEDNAEIAERLGPYRLITRIGEGGMGVVHLGLDPEGRTVAVKVLRPQVAADATSRARLAREVETMRRVSSPNIAEVLDADLGGERPYVVTRYVQGRSLHDVVTGDGPLHGAALVRLARGLAGALSAIHAAGVVHRDVKPSNVMLVDGDPVVIDFGVAQAVDATQLTQTGMFMGTPAYLAPEMLEGAGPHSAADVHAWGAVVAFAATGRSPFGSGSVESVFANIVQGHADLGGVPEPLASMVRSALARDPASRPPADWLRERATRLPRALDGPVTPPGPSGNGVGAGWGDGSGPYGGQNAPRTRAYTAAAPANPAAPPGPHPGHDLPPARQAGTGAGTADPDPAAPVDRRPPRKPYQLHSVVNWLLVAIWVSFTTVAPFVGAALITATLLLLRAADGVAAGLETRRSRRGPRGVDPVLGVVGLPWHLARSTLSTALILPLALLAGAAVAGGLWVLDGKALMPDRALAFGGCAFALTALLGPGGGKPRRRAQRGVAAVLPVWAAALAVTAILGFVLLFVLAAVGSNTVVWWPVTVHPRVDVPDLAQLVL